MMEACSAATLAVRTSELLSAVESRPLAELMVAWSLVGSLAWDPVVALETPEALAAAPVAAVDSGGAAGRAEGDGVVTLLLAIWA